MTLGEEITGVIFCIIPWIINPFDNLSSDNENQYFADGIVEDLLYRISQIDGLKVISRTSSEISNILKDIPELIKVSDALRITSEMAE